ncbi:carbonic anhydrase [Trichomonascus vanleenenianus]|uniref:carbonate dehydratase NCE103 n=1 Tax=Trichomonascus vanleenenianus TaxID=2268995 RepID=UPI003ECA4A3E
MAKNLFRHAAGDTIESLLKRNAEWAKRMSQNQPALFPTNAQGQSPQILWIGCCDSRAGDACLDLLPGEVFVHRNIANVVSHGDLSSLSVIQFAVDVLKVTKIVVCGHYDCGGIWTSLTTKKLGGEMDTWLRQLKEVKVRHRDVLSKIENVKEKCDKLVELNVVDQVHNLKRNDRVMRAIRTRNLEVCGLVYDVASGLLKQLEVPEDSHEEEFAIADQDGSLH